LSRRLKLILGVGALAIVMAALSAILRPESPRQQFFGLRPDLSDARRAADACAAELEVEQADFDKYVDRVEDLRTRIAEFEALDERGVPARDYPQYLFAVDTFNAILPGWEAAADTLRTHRQACEELVRVHNALADSARALAEQAELLDRQGPPPDRP
jgi:hypothetical protein